MVRDEGKTVGAVARELDLTPSALADWVRKAQADRTKGRTGLTGVEREELTRLRKENREVADGTRGAKKSRGLLREGPPVKFAWIHTEKATYPVTKLCRWLGVTPSGYYAWRARPESAHRRRDRQLKVLIRASFEAHKSRYGSPRIYGDLQEAKEPVSKKRVARLMREDDLKARPRKRFKVTTMSDHDQPVADNLLDRQFTAEAPNQRWVGDTTEFVIGESSKAGSGGDPRPLLALR